MKKIVPEEKKAFCYYSGRCGKFGPGCTPDVAEKTYCAFIRAIEEEKNCVAEAVLEILSFDGQYLTGDERIISLRTEAGRLTDGEFAEAESVAVMKFAVIKKEKEHVKKLVLSVLRRETSCASRKEQIGELKKNLKHMTIQQFVEAEKEARCEFLAARGEIKECQRLVPLQDTPDDACGDIFGNFSI